jgi:hypothetical protein
MENVMAGAAAIRAAPARRPEVEETPMLISVSRAGRGIFHFSGNLDAYSFGLLHELTSAGRLSEGAELKIRIDPSEEAALRERKGWLEALTRAGASVLVERAPARPFRESWYETLKARGNGTAEPAQDKKASR